MNAVVTLSLGGWSLRPAGLALAAGLLCGVASADSSAPYAPCTVDTTGVEKAVGLPFASHAKITDDLLAVAERVKAAKAAKEVSDLKQQIIKGRGNPLFVTKEDGRLIEVYIALHELSDAAVSDVRKAGVQVDIVAEDRPLLQGLVPVELLEDVAALDVVREVRLPSYGIPTASGRVTTEGESRLGVPFVRRRNLETVGMVDGTGVNVAVLSTALFNNDSRSTGAPLTTRNCGPLQQSVATTQDGRSVLAPSDLPSPDPCTTLPAGYLGGNAPGEGVRIIPAAYIDHLIDPDEQDTSVVPFPEGSAMLEVVHDLAPGAALYYGRGRTSLELQKNRGFFMRSLDDPADVIIDNLVFTDDGRFDGSSAISVHATNLCREFNVPYFVSVGGTTPANENGVTEPLRFPMMITDLFNGDTRINRAKAHSWAKGVLENRDEGLNFDPSGPNGLVPIDVTLVWDDYWSDAKPRATTDFDLYLVPRSTLALNQAVAASVRVQNGSGTNPVERLTYFPTPTTPPLALVVVRADGTNDSKTLFTLIIESGRVSESRYLTHGIPLNNADALKPVVSVGDVDITNDDTISSWAVPGRNPGNPALDRFLEWYEGQNAPTIVSYGSVTTWTTTLVSTPVTDEYPRVLGFWGPSAAVAHMGGYAALLRHRFPEMPTYRLGELLSDTSGIADDGSFTPPFAKDVTPEETRTWPNAPRYLETNGGALYAALEDGITDPYGGLETKVDLPAAAPETVVADAAGTTAPAPTAPVDDQAGWNSVADGADVRITDMGLEISGGSSSATGAWVSPLLAIQDPGTSSPRTQLRTDRIYSLQARVGSTESNAAKVPDFRLSVASDGGGEVYALTVGSAEQGGNPPTTIGGNVYNILFAPSNAQIAEDGFRFVFELLGAAEGDNAGATLVLRDVTLRELPLPDDQTAPQ